MRATTTPSSTAPITDARAQFEREMAMRFPAPLLVTRFVMPRNVRDCREVYFRELDSLDEREAAKMADLLTDSVEKSSSKLMAEAERKECIRIALVGYGKVGAGGAVVYKHTNDSGVPLDEINGWRLPAWTSLHRYFGELNGVPTAELEEGIRGAQIVGAPAPPSGETLASADTGRSAGSTGTST